MTVLDRDQLAKISEGAAAIANTEELSIADVRQLAAYLSELAEALAIGGRPLGELLATQSATAAPAAAEPQAEPEDPRCKAEYGSMRCILQNGHGGRHEAGGVGANFAWGAA